MKLFTCLIILIICSLSCSTLKQDMKNVDKAAIRHPGETAEKLRAHWPCIVHNGDTIKISDSAAYAAALMEMQDTAASFYWRNVQLQYKLDSVQKDSLCYALVELYTQIIANQKADYAKLEYKAAHLPPIHDIKLLHDTTVDVAAVAAANSERLKQLVLANDYKDQRDVAQSKATKRGKIMWWLIGAITTFVGWNAYKFFKPKIKAS